MNSYSRISLFVILAVTIAFLGTPRAEFYKWEDADGNVHFTDDLTTVPPSYRDEARVEELPDQPVNITPAPKVSTTPATTSSRDPSKPANEYAECKKRVEEEKKRWSDQLDQDQGRLAELNRLIRRTVTSRQKNAYQRERVAVKERINQAEEVLRDALTPMERECEAIGYWQGNE
jgi:hypothetical protein